MLNRNFLCFCVATLCLVASTFVFPAGLAAQEDASSVDFVKSVKPILEKYCVSCHGEVDPDAFRIDIADEAMDYVVEGSAEDSDLYLVMVSEDEYELMPPPDDENPMDEKEIAVIKAWIDQGAEWPDGIQLAAVTSEAERPGPDGDPEKSGDAPSAAKLTSPDQSEESQKESPAEEPEVDPKVQRVYNAVGSLHPAVIHLPIGLLLAAGLFALFSLRGNFVMSDCAYYCLWLGAIGSVLGSVTGWWFSPMERVGTVNEFNDLFDQTHRVFWHRTSAFIVTAASLLLALFAAGARNRDPDDGVLWKLGLIFLAAAIGWVGHEGGKLTHGKHLYDDLWSIVTDIVPALQEDDGPAADDGKAAAGQQESPPTDPSSQSDSNEAGVGDTSDET